MIYGLGIAHIESMKQGGLMTNRKKIKDFYQTHSKLINVMMLSAFACTLISCGSKKTDNGELEFASRVVEGANTNNSNRALAYCNHKYSQYNNFRAALMIYEDFQHQVLPNFINMKLVKVPTDFADTSNFIEIWRWQVNSNGQRNIDSETPVSFKLVSVDTGMDITSYMQWLRWSDISNTAKNLGFSNPTDFFKKVRFVLDIRDPYGQYDALNIVYYNSYAQALDQMDILLPIFDADPFRYATESDGSTRSNYLTALHPFREKYNNGESWNVQTYQSWANDLCVPFNQ